MITFNGGQYLRAQIDSIVTQHPPPDELVIGDDGSTDKTIELIRELVRGSTVPVRFAGDGDHVGLRLNVQRTIEACTGDVIVLSDQDDVWLPGKIAAVHDAFTDPEVMLWFSDAEMIDESGGLVGGRLWDLVTLPPDEQARIVRGDGLSRLIHGQTVTGATMAFKATLRDLVLPLPVELELGDHIYLHDGWIAVLASLMGKSVLDPTPRVQYRRHSQQVTGSVGPRDQGPAHRLGLAADGLLAAEYARAKLVLARLQERDALARCRDADAAMLVDLESLLAARTMPPGAARVRAILREAALGRYSRYARGWRTAGGDLLLRRGIPATQEQREGSR